MGAMCVGSAQECRVTNEIVVPFCLHYCRGCAPGVCIKRCRRVRCERVCYVHRPAANNVQREESCVHDQRELFLVSGLRRERPLIGPIRPRRYFPSILTPPRNQMANEDVECSSSFEWMTRVKLRTDFFFFLDGLDCWIIWLSFTSSNYADSSASSLRLWLSRQRSVLLSVCIFGRSLHLDVYNIGM